MTRPLHWDTYEVEDFLPFDCNKHGVISTYLAKGSLPEDHKKVEVRGPDHVLALHVVGNQRVLLGWLALVLRLPLHESTTLERSKQEGKKVRKFLLNKY